MPCITIRGKECYYEESGEGFPLIFGHSYLWDSHMWKSQIELLSQSFRCLSVDLWDHGRSGHLERSATSIDELADDYEEFIKALGIEEFGLIGLSVGGMWAAELALRHPDSTKALVLMDTFVGGEPDLSRQRYFAMLEGLERAGQFQDPLLDHVIPLFFSPYTLEHNGHLAEEFRASLKGLSREAIPGIVALGRAIFSRPCRLNLLEKVQVPTLVLVGRDDSARPVFESQKMAELIPNSELVIVENAGHITTVEQPEVVTEALSSFLSRTLTASSTH